MRIVLTANSSFALANFRGGLIRALRQEGDDLVALVPKDTYSEELFNAGCRVVPIKMNRRGTSLIEEVMTFAGIFVGLRAVRPDVILSFTIKSNIYSGLSASVLGAPFVPNVTGLGTLFATDSVLARVVSHLYRAAFRTSKTVFFQNSDDLDVFIRARIVSGAQARILPGSGVDLCRFKPWPLSGGKDDPTFLLIARLLRDKGIVEFVDAARAVRKEFPRARFWLLGAYEADGPAAITAAETEKWVADGDIEYLGTSRNVLPIIQAADCIVLPSYYPEGTPRVLLEAAASGRPVVTTDTSGCRGPVEDGVSGLLVRPRDVAALTHGMLVIARASPESRTEMGLAGRRRMEQLYDETNVVNAYLEVLRELRGAGMKSSGTSPGSG